MELSIYNTLTRQKELFQPIDPKNVGMYVCGITPYNETHLGHGRAYVTFDVIRRYLKYLGFKVKYVQNITDVDDKIIAKAQTPSDNNQTSSKSQIPDPKRKCQEVVDKYLDSYYEVMKKLNVQRADEEPKATKHIPEMIKWVEGLVAKSYAYELDDGVYFEVGKFKDYGKLSGRKLEDNEAGARVAVDTKKRSPLDFALWKKAKEGEPSWPSPWGEGRPGWHIECSVMSTKYLGEQFDIHGGGLDLEFPHHENEIAQTEALTGKVPWVKYWVHNGFVNINKQKMSKSLGNFFTLREIFEKYSPMVVRLFLLSTHYRSPIDFSNEQLEESKAALLSIENVIRDYNKLADPLMPIDAKKVSADSFIQKFRKSFFEAMDDDFNTAQAIAIVFLAVNFMNTQIKIREHDQNVLKMLFDFLNILGININLDMPKEIQALEEKVNEERKKENYPAADADKEKIREKGFEVRDTTLGTITSGSSIVIWPTKGGAK